MCSGNISTSSTQFPLVKVTYCSGHAHRACHSNYAAQTEGGPKMHAVEDGAALREPARISDRQRTAEEAPAEQTKE